VKQRYPADSQEWLADLQQAGIGHDFDDSLAAILRVVASIHQRPVCLCSGVEVLPYVNWLRDGMSMSGRLIIHLAPEHRELDEIVQRQLDSDIRVASHYQDIQRFCADISQHRVDLLLVDVGDDSSTGLDGLMPLLNENALSIVLAKKVIQEILFERYSSDYFVAPISASGQALMLARVGQQHQLGRRRGRNNRPA
jgi:hypothetical protein